MIVGLPVAGLSTVFYLLCTFLMVLHTFYQLVRGRKQPPERTRLMFRQLTISAGIVMMLFAVAAVISFFISKFFPIGLSFDNHFVRAIETITSLGIYIALPTLAVLFIVIQFLSMVVSERHQNQEQNPLVKQKIAAKISNQYTNKQQNEQEIKPRYHNPIHIVENSVIPMQKYQKIQPNLAIDTCDYLEGAKTVEKRVV